MPIGPLAVFTYLVTCPETKQGAVIDPAGAVDPLLDRIRAEGVSVRYILNTHGHSDHVEANRSLQKRLSRTGAVPPVCMHEADDAFFSGLDIRPRSGNDPGFPGPEPADLRLRDGDILELGRIEIEVIHTPGHTPGSVCFRIGNNLITGDTLFVGAVGRTDLPGGAFDTLLDSLARRIIVLPETTVIWPGHDYGETPTSTVGREMAENPYITDFLPE
jgi:hydroxyacylglutathione hydrolase